MEPSDGRRPGRPPRAGSDRAPCSGPRGTGADSPGLPAWLDEEEWNTCFFLGQQAYYRDGEECRVCEQVCLGARQLGAAGYRFRNVRLGPDASWAPVEGAAAPARDRDACAQLAAHTFDHHGRVIRAVAWLGERAPGVDRGWLEEQVRLVRRLHGG